MRHSKQDRYPSFRLSPLFTLAALFVTVLICFSLTGCGSEKGNTANSLSGFLKIRERAESYLNNSGKELARGRTKGASIYSVDATLDTGEKCISGNEKVLYTNRTSDTLTEVVFRVYADGAGVENTEQTTVINNAKVDGHSADSSLEDSVLSITVPGGIKPGGKTQVSFSFTETVPPIDENNTGGLFAYGEGTFNLGYFLPTVVMYTDAGWDKRDIPSDGDADNFDCSYYQVSITAPDNYTVAATGVEIENKGGTHVFTAGPVRDFEAQASSRYESREHQVGSTTVTSYYYGADSSSGFLALDAACNALSFYSDHFGAYPYTRLNVCEGPAECYGMEYTGQVQIGSFVYSDPEYMEDLEVTVAHEVCHQWWALGVGSDVIGFPWLDESLTTYCESLYCLWLEGESSRDEALSEIADYYTSARDEDIPDAVVEQPVDTFESGDQYTSIVYGKGALFFDELRNLLGTHSFEKSLSEYYRDNVFLDTTTEELLSSFSENSNDPGGVDALYRRWIKELHGDEDIYEY